MARHIKARIDWCYNRIIHPDCTRKIQNASEKHFRHVLTTILIPCVTYLFRNKYTKDVKTSRVQNKEESKEKCGNCEEKKKERKKCTGCFHIWYCDRECQLQHWDKHKHECKVNVLCKVHDLKF